MLLGRPWVLVLVPVAVLVLPLAGIARARRLRQESIGENLPDFLDVLAVTVTAGVGFRAALATVGERFGGPLGEEMTLALQQIHNGSSVRDAFEKLRRPQRLRGAVAVRRGLHAVGGPGRAAGATLTRISADTRRASAQSQRQKAARVAPRVTLVTSMVLVPGSLALLFTGFVLGADVDFASLLGSLGEPGHRPRAGPPAGVTVGMVRVALLVRQLALAAAVGAAFVAETTLLTLGLVTALALTSQLGLRSTRVLDLVQRHPSSRSSTCSWWRWPAR